MNTHSAQRVIHRLILPEDPTPDLMPLYVEQHSVVGTSVGTLGSDAEGRSRAERRRGESSTMAASVIGLAGVDDAMGRTQLMVPPHALRSFGTYFNAFPASYWRRWTPVRSITLRIRTEGTGRILVYRSNARGNVQRQEYLTVTGQHTSEFTLPLTAFGDGGWYWFDVVTGEESLQLLGAEWLADASLAREDGRVSLAVTTMNKVDYCLDTIRTVSRSEEILSILDAMYVVDQGSDRLQDHAELAPLRDAMGERLQIIEQGNIGGSGGFSRGMYEASTRETAAGGTSQYVINCDDDIIIEPETIVRLKTFADFATRPTIVGAHMFDMGNRSVLHAFGEVVNPWRFLWMLPSDDYEYGHDFAAHSLRSSPLLHRRLDVDYNGWWTCLIPTDVVREIGLSLPVFIKWDDAEYGLRAKAAGYPTVSLPGAAVWHVSWTDKDDSTGWQAFYHERNRFIAALLHSPYERGGRLIKESNFMDIKHLISMEYFTQHARLLAQESVLAGPEHLHRSIGTDLPRIRALTQDYIGAQYRDEPDEFPRQRMNKPPRRGRGFSQPNSTILPAWTAKTLAKQMFVPARPSSRTNPETAVAHADARWWRLSAYDSAVVSNAEGTKVAWYQRDPQAVRTLLSRAVRTHAELFRRWPQLRAQYRAAAQELASFAAWEQTFRDNPAPVRDADAEKPGAARQESGTSAPPAGPAA